MNPVRLPSLPFGTALPQPVAASSPTGSENAAALETTRPAPSSSAPRTLEHAPDVQTRLDALENSDCVGVQHTTRGIPRERMHEPLAPRPFAAGRFAVNFRDRSSGEETGYIFQTEAGPGHLGRVVPGETPIPGGYISLLADPQNPFSAETRLDKSNVDCLLDRLHARFKQPMTDDQSARLQNVLDFAYAIRHAGEGTAAVSAAYQQRTASC